MANVYLLNQFLTSDTHTTSGMWALTRAMKKAGWRYLASSTGLVGGVDASTTPNPFNDKWGSGVVVPGQTGSAASITTKTLDDLVITGLTGMGLNSIGNFLTFTGASSAGNNTTVQVTELISATSVKVRNTAGVAADANNGAISWTERDPTLESYPTAFDSQLAWWVAQGPTTFRVPIAALPTGTFLRGEKVTQTGSNAEGELLGVVWTNATTSFLVILARVGTFNSSGTVTGAISGATVAAAGTVVTFVQEVCIAKHTNVIGGWVISQRVDATAEATQRLSYLAQQGFATYNTAPGNGTGSNALPVTAFMVKGTIGGGNNWAYWFPTVTSFPSSNMGAAARAQFVATNCIGTPGVSPDGTFWYLQSLPGNTTYNTALVLFGQFRMDDTEVGDVDPFVWLASASGAATRTDAQAGSYVVSDTNNGPLWSNNAGNWSTWRRRGYGTNDSFAWLGQASLNIVNSSTPLVIVTRTDPERIACHTDSLFVREPVWLVNSAAGTRMRKGTIRWMSITPSGTPFTLWENKQWIQLVSPGTGIQPGFVLGPWDGATDPIYV